VFTAQITLNEATTGIVPLYATAAYSRQLRRISSQLASVQVIPQPNVTWSVPNIQANVSAGGSKTFTLSFVASKSFDHASIIVSAALQPFLQVSPPELNSTSAGQSVRVDVTVSVPASSLPQTITGNIQLRAADGNDIPSPLPVTLNMIWATYSNPQAGVQMSYPDFGVASKVEASTTSSGLTFLDATFQSPGDTTFVSGFGIYLHHNTAHLSLADWFRKNMDPDGTLLSSGAFKQVTLINGMSAFLLSGPLPDNFGPTMSAYSISPSGNTIVSIGQSEDNQLGTLGLNKDQLNQVMLEVLSNLQTP
jgi:hypothetical protein